MTNLKSLPDSGEPARGVGAQLKWRGKDDAPGSMVVELPPFRGAVLAEIHAWATGYGDPAYDPSTANLMLRINGEPVETRQDTRFTLYELVINHALTIPAQTATTITAQWDNHLATEAGDPAHGLTVTLKQV